MESGEERAVGRSIAWVVVVVGVGFLAGALLALAVPTHPGPPGPGGGAGPGPVGVNRIGIALSTVDLALLAALVVVYGKTYVDTRARFALGITLVLVALGFQTLFGSPLLFGAFGYGPGGLGPFLSISYLFETFALAAFLYLSLE